MNTNSEIVKILKNSAKTVENDIIRIHLTPFDWGKLTIYLKQYQEPPNDLLEENNRLKEENKQLKEFFMSSARILRNDLHYQWEQFEKNFSR